MPAVEAVPRPSILGRLMSEGPGRPGCVPAWKLAYGRPGPFAVGDGLESRDDGMLGQCGLDQVDIRGIIFDDQHSIVIQCPPVRYRRSR